MKRADLVRSVQVQFKNMDAESAALITDGVFEMLEDAIVRGDRIELRGLGVFQGRTHMTKIGFNPKTRERAAVAAARTVKFRPSAKLIKEMNE